MIEAHYGRLLGAIPMVRHATNTSRDDASITVTIPGTEAWGSSEGTLPPSAGFEDPAVSPHILTMYWSLSVSMFAVGGMVSSFTVGWIGDRMGR